MEQAARQTIAQAEPPLRPPAEDDEDDQEPPPDVLPPVEVDVDPPLPQDLAVPVVSATPPEQPRLSARGSTSRVPAEQARPPAEARPSALPSPPRATPPRATPPRPARAAVTASKVDLASLEQKLRQVTDQSMRDGTAAERATLFATSARFVERLGRCTDDLCRRDAYLARSQEITRIKRN